MNKDVEDIIYQENWTNVDEFKIITALKQLYSQGLLRNFIISFYENPNISLVTKANIDLLICKLLLWENSEESILTLTALCPYSAIPDSALKTVSDRYFFTLLPLVNHENRSVRMRMGITLRRQMIKSGITIPNTFHFQYEDVQGLLTDFS
jgi:hypothetical protein